MTNSPTDLGEGTHGRAKTIMRRALVAAFAFAWIIYLTVPSGAVFGDYPRCLLDKLPNTQNKAAALAALRICRAEYPDELKSSPKGSGRWWLSRFDSGDECLLHFGSGTSDAFAASWIGQACRHLYDPSMTQAQLDELDAMLKKGPKSGAF